MFVSFVAIKMITTLVEIRDESKTRATPKMKVDWNPLTNVKKISFSDEWDHASATVDI